MQTDEVGDVTDHDTIDQICCASSKEESKREPPGRSGSGAPREHCDRAGDNDGHSSQSEPRPRSKETEGQPAVVDVTNPEGADGLD